MLSFSGTGPLKRFLSKRLYTTKYINQDTKIYAVCCLYLDQVSDNITHTVFSVCTNPNVLGIPPVRLFWSKTLFEDEVTLIIYCPQWHYKSFKFSVTPVPQQLDIRYISRYCIKATQTTTISKLNILQELFTRHLIRACGEGISKVAEAHAKIFDAYWKCISLKYNGTHAFKQRLTWEFLKVNALIA